MKNLTILLFFLAVIFLMVSCIGSKKVSKTSGSTESKSKTHESETSGSTETKNSNHWSWSRREGGSIQNSSLSLIPTGIFTISTDGAFHGEAQSVVFHNARTESHRVIEATEKKDSVVIQQKKEIETETGQSEKHKITDSKVTKKTGLTGLLISAGFFLLVLIGIWLIFKKNKTSILKQLKP